MRLLMLAGCCGLLLSGCSGMEATEELPEDHWSKSPAAVPFMKIGRGAANILVCPLDIPATVVRVVREEDNAGKALGAGTLEGIGNCLVRLLMGVAEVLTFPLVNDPEPLYDRDLGDRAFPSDRELTPEPG